VALSFFNPFTRLDYPIESVLVFFDAVAAYPIKAVWGGVAKFNRIVVTGTRFSESTKAEFAMIVVPIW
jgi:hypothetical protein